MSAEFITIQVDSESAKAYRAKSDEERRKIDLLLELHLMDALRPCASLEEIMDEMSRNAQQRGLTPEILDER